MLVKYLHSGSKGGIGRAEFLTSHHTHTALRSTPELASPGVKISFLFKGFLLLFPIHDLIDAKKFDANFHQLLLLPSVFLTPKSGNWRRRTRFWRQDEDQE
jgi:hypothetical protein